LFWQIEYLIVVARSNSFDLVLQGNKLVLGIERIQHFHSLAPQRLLQLLNKVIVPLAVDFVDEKIWVGV